MKIAWVSRHEPLPAQIQELKRLFGSCEIVRLPKTFQDARELLSDVRSTGASTAVVVAPLSMIEVLLREGEDIRWLRAEMRALHECVHSECPEFRPDTDVWLPLHGSEKGRHMRFAHFSEICEVRVITRPLLTEVR